MQRLPNEHSTNQQVRGTFDGPTSGDLKKKRPFCGVLIQRQKSLCSTCFVSAQRFMRETTARHHPYSRCDRSSLCFSPFITSASLPSVLMSVKEPARAAPSHWLFSAPGCNPLFHTVQRCCVHSSQLLSCLHFISLQRNSRRLIVLDRSQPACEQGGVA